MLRATLDRIEAVPDTAASIVVCNAGHRHVVESQLAGLAHRLILEPLGRNTAPAAAAAALLTQADGDDPVLLVLPADHLIQDEGAFRTAIAVAVVQARGGKLVTFGIVPTDPETGYGYIHRGDRVARGVHTVKAFVEKPDRPAAERYVAGGEHRWNSGMFAFRASTYLTELERFDPQLAAGVRAATTSSNGTITLDRAAWEACPSDSIDYAVMEHTSEAVVVDLDAGWSDVGSWGALWEALPKDDAGNVAVGDTLLHDTRASYVRSENRLVATVGLENIVIVDTADALLVADRSSSQDVKAIVAALIEEGRVEGAKHPGEQRPWGRFDILGMGDGFQVKRIQVDPGARLSLQSHRHRAETWVVIAGTATVTIDESTELLPAGESINIPLGARHRLANDGDDEVVLVEIQLGTYLGEDDITRYEDAYGRS